MTVYVYVDLKIKNTAETNLANELEISNILLGNPSSMFQQETFFLNCILLHPGCCYVHQPSKVTTAFQQCAALVNKRGHSQLYLVFVPSQVVAGQDVVLPSDEIWLCDLDSGMW